ncbi:hypothetical protein SK128_026988 [Halocaridina rubra]|uniref:Uncharacterized protein n=1 Tax=Halocaridina rubra TaxID=373956 RepID=A0AAN8X5A8_HALRR
MKLKISYLCLIFLGFVAQNALAKKRTKGDRQDCSDLGGVCLLEGNNQLSDCNKKLADKGDCPPRHFCCKAKKNRNNDDNRGKKVKLHDKEDKDDNKEKENGKKTNKGIAAKPAKKKDKANAKGSKENNEEGVEDKFFFCKNTVTSCRFLGGFCRTENEVKSTPSCSNNRIFPDKGCSTCYCCIPGCEASSGCSNVGGYCSQSCLKEERPYTSLCPSSGSSSCTCCVPPCKLTSACFTQGGHCVSDGQACSGTLTDQCEGHNCKCCIPELVCSDNSKCGKNGQCKSQCGRGEKERPNGCSSPGCKCCESVCKMKSKCKKEKGKCKAKCKPKETEIPRGCKGKKCKCCVRKAPPCKNSKKCERAKGVCTKKKLCKGETFNKKLCKGKCGCCIGGDCQSTKKCQKFKGRCGSEKCKAGERMIKNGCGRSKKCKCCAPGCEILPECSNAGGFCVDKRKDCPVGYILTGGCSGKKCKCCQKGTTTTTTATTTTATSSTSTGMYLSSQVPGIKEKCQHL